MLEQLREKVYIANQDLLELSTYPFSWISVSAIDRSSGTVVLMPDGGAVTEEDMVLMDLKGNFLDGKEPPVRDASIHLALYEQFPQVGSIARPYCRWTTVFSQLEMCLPALGTVHADTFPGNIPVTQGLTSEILQIPGDVRIAQAIVQAYGAHGVTPCQIPAVLVNNYGAYTFGKNAREAVGHAAILEEAAFLAYHTMQMDPGIRPMQLIPQVR